jgi:hypothetical protein
VARSAGDDHERQLARLRVEREPHARCSRGDAPAEVERRGRARRAPCEVLKLGHHGSGPRAMSASSM